MANETIVGTLEEVIKGVCAQLGKDPESIHRVIRLPIDKPIMEDALEQDQEAVYVLFDDRTFAVITGSDTPYAKPT